MLYDADIPEPPDPRIDRTEERQRFLRQALEWGMENLEMATRRARVVTQAMEAGAMEAVAEPPKGVDPGDVFTRLFRGVRFALVLEAKVDDDLFALRAGTYVPEPRRAPRGPLSGDSPTLQPDRMARRDQIHGHVTELANPESYEEEERERIYGELHENLYESERYDALLDLPLEKAVETICNDLGVRPQYERWKLGNWPSWRVGRPPPEPPPPPEDAEPERDAYLAKHGKPPWPPP